MLTFEGINNAHHQAHNFILVAGNCLHALKEHTYLFVCCCRATFAVESECKSFASAEKELRVLQIIVW